MLTDDEIIEVLVSAGCMPSMVDEALLDAERAKQELPTPEEIEEDSTVNAEDFERLRQFWWYTNDVPRKFKRLLSASDV